VKSKILVTGGAGYIGSHTVLALLEQGHDVIVLDNLINSKKTALRHITEITGRAITFIEGDVLDFALLMSIFNHHRILAVLHFAGLKAVGESMTSPLHYYENNVSGTVNLLKAMEKNKVFNFVFSSSATVYGNTEAMPISEEFPLSKPTNPYGNSKLVVEDILRDMQRADDRWRVAILRYFNPIGAHSSGLLGENPCGIPNNLMPLLSRVAIGQLPELLVYGSDHKTPDGTGIRDYIHVVDVAEGHLKALERIIEKGGIGEWNLGTGVGYSVLEVIAAFERVTKKQIPYRFAAKRPGDVAKCWSDPTKASRDLGWVASRDLKDMIQDTWRWQTNCSMDYSET
jgi:UDP-glucose 4-epimerase